MDRTVASGAADSGSIPDECTKSTHCGCFFPLVGIVAMYRACGAAEITPAFVSVVIRAVENENSLNSQYLVRRAAFSACFRHEIGRNISIKKELLEFRYGYLQTGDFGL